MKGSTYLHLYDFPGVKTLRIQELMDYVQEKVPGIQIESRSEFFRCHLTSRAEMRDFVAESLARCKVRSIDNPSLMFDPLPGEIDYEKRSLREPEFKPFGILYDGIRFLRVLWELMPEVERGLEHTHIVLTNQLLGTYDKNDRRYHARIGVFGIPSAISTTGTVEGPAKPKEFFLLKQQYAAMGMENDLLRLKKQFQSEFIDYDDERLTEVLKGYVMQAVFYHVTGTPFCNDPNCRLYNAHWQREMIHAQRETPYEFCDHHESLLRQLG